MSTTVTQKGQVTIPKVVRDRLGLKAGSKVEFDTDGTGRAYLRQATDDHEVGSRLERFRGILPSDGMSTDAFMELIRGEDR